MTVDDPPLIVGCQRLKMMKLKIRYHLYGRNNIGTVSNGLQRLSNCPYCKMTIIPMS